MRPIRYPLLCVHLNELLMAATDRCDLGHTLHRRRLVFVVRYSSCSSAEHEESDGTYDEEGCHDNTHGNTGGGTLTEPVGRTRA